MIGPLEIIDSPISIYDGNIDSITVTKDSALIDAVMAINKSNAQIALVCDGDKKLIGTITDGDVRRALINGLDMSSAVLLVMCKNFTSLSGMQSLDSVRELMVARSVRQIPILDNDGRAIKLYYVSWKYQSENLLNWAVVIMAGGRGERLGSLTKYCPKPMIKLHDKPMLEIIIGRCRDVGLKEFYISVNYLKDKIKDHFRDGSQFGVNIRYIEEVSPLGTAGALSLLPNEIPDHVLVINGDVLTAVDIASLCEHHVKSGYAATTCVIENKIKIPYGVVHSRNGLVEHTVEKPIVINHINAGIYVLNTGLLSKMTEGLRVDMPAFLGQIISEGGKVGIFPIFEYWLDVGLPETLERARREWV